MKSMISTRTKTDEEINISLAGFDGWEIYDFAIAGKMWIKKEHEFVDFKDQLYEGEILKLEHLSKQYTKSLDSLIFIVEKLDKSLMVVYASSLNEWVADEMLFGEMTRKYETRDASPSRALALTCLKVIEQM